MSGRFPGRARGAIVAIAAVFAVGACGRSASPIGPRAFASVACPIDMPNSPTAPPGFAIVAPGTIVFTEDAWQNVSGASSACGLQAVRGGATRFALSTLAGEDRIMWVATLDRLRAPMTPDPALPKMTLARLDAAGSVEVATLTDELGAYNMLGNYGHDAQPGSYLMRIVSASGELLAEGRFEIVR